MTDGVWTGSINEPYRFAARVGFYDTTLRDGEQAVGVVLSPEAKLEIARLLDELGVGRIEAGFPRVSEEDRRAIELIAAAELRAEVWGFARAVRADVDALVDLGLRSAVVESPLSDLKLDALGVTRETMLGRIETAVAHAVGRGLKVAYFGVDGTRADPAFLEQAYRVAVDAGAEEAVLVDTIGVASPEAVEALVRRIGEALGADVPLHFHGHNDFGLATAAAIAAARAGVRWIHGTVNGMGERAGNASLAEVALALRALYGVDTGLRLERARGVAARVRELADHGVEPWKPLVGDNLFTRESGAVASQFHDPPAIEPYPASLVGAGAERRIVLGKKSGLDSIRIKCEELGLQVSPERYPDLLRSVKELGTASGSLVSDEDFQRLVNRAP